MVKLLLGGFEPGPTSLCGCLTKEEPIVWLMRWQVGEQVGCTSLFKTVPWFSVYYLVIPIRWAMLSCIAANSFAVESAFIETAVAIRNRGINNEDGRIRVY